MSTNMNDCLRMRLARYIHEKFAPEYTIDKILEGQKIVSSQIIDSLGIINLISYIERTYNVSISQSDMKVDSFDSVDAIVNLINLKKA